MTIIELLEAKGLKKEEINEFVNNNKEGFEKINKIVGKELSEESLELEIYEDVCTFGEKYYDVILELISDDDFCNDIKRFIDFTAYGRCVINGNVKEHSLWPNETGYEFKSSNRVVIIRSKPSVKEILNRIKLNEKEIEEILNSEDYLFAFTTAIDDICVRDTIPPEKLIKVFDSYQSVAQFYIPQWLLMKHSLKIEDIDNGEMLLELLKETKMINSGANIITLDSSSKRVIFID